MKKSRKDLSTWSLLAAKLLHPVPVFFIVTALAALVYVVPNLRQEYNTSATSLYRITTIILNIMLPLATGLIAAFSVYFGLLELRRKARGRDLLDDTDSLYTPDDRIRSITRNLPRAAITIDKDSKVTYFNPAASHLLNVENPEVPDAVHKFINSNDLGSSLEEIFNGDSITVDKTGTLPDTPDSEYTWRITGVPITRHDKVVEALLLIEDRTQVRMLEDELIRSEDRYRNIFNHAPCGIFFADSRGHYLDANPAALEMLGYTLDELTTLSTRELSTDSDRRMRRLRETPGWVEDEAKYLRKDGKVVDAQLLASSYQSGNDTYFIGITRDVTARKELERNLSAAKARLKAVLSLESRPLLLLDADDRISNINSAAAQLLDCPSEKLKGLPLGDLIKGDPPPLQETSSASPSPYVFNIPDGPPLNLSVIRLALGRSAKSGSLILLSSGPVPVSSSEL